MRPSGARWRRSCPAPSAPTTSSPRTPLVLEPHDNRLGDPVDAVANGFAISDLEGRLKDAAEAAAHCGACDSLLCFRKHINSIVSKMLIKIVSFLEAEVVLQVC
ncbi:cytidine deaminase 1-like [Hordeum vulgare]|nr:cytidine deaminase 1-like [Hordeum vulgare]